MENVSKTSTVLSPDSQMIPKGKQLMFPTVGLIIFLVVTFGVLKTFIYIKDKDERHGK
jgi:hypothetical protein